MLYQWSPWLGCTLEGCVWRLAPLLSYISCLWARCVDDDDLIVCRSPVGSTMAGGGWEELGDGIGGGADGGGGGGPPLNLRCIYIDRSLWCNEEIHLMVWKHQAIMHICKFVKYYRAMMSYKFKDLVFHLFFVNDHIQFRTSHFKGNIKLNKILVAVLLTHFIMLCGLNLFSQ